ncbi:FIG01270615: hypothetical protein [hydrothermal vent metagenome]|uniref:Lipoprotein n=1 Tax=hydrothermal vent metagenome TaxID=652676 RepID=A0A1W1CH15_9ZZZZ
MKTVSLITLTTAVVFFSACSSKRYFEPETTFSASHASYVYGGNIVDLSRNGGTLSNGTYLGKAGVNSIELGEGYRFLDESNTYILASNAEGLLKVIDKQTKETIRVVSLHVPVVSATIQNGIIAYVLNNNTFGVYRMKDNRKVVESRSESTFAIDTRAASPMFIENLIVMPMLDGKLIIININHTENAKVVYISSESAFNNVIYLSRMGNTMVAATPKRLITLGGAGKLEYKANISEVAIVGKKIYLFTKEGKILALNSQLEVVASSKFKFAHYAAATAFDSKVYALDQEGSLIVLNTTLSKSKIYELGAVDEPVFISGTKLYKDGEVIELSKLGYE